MIRIKTSLKNSCDHRSSLSPPTMTAREGKGSCFEERMKLLAEDKNQGPTYTDSETLFSTLVKKDANYPRQLPLTRPSTLTKSLKRSQSTGSFKSVTNGFSLPTAAAATSGLPKLYGKKYSRSIPTPSNVSPSLSSGSSSMHGSPSSLPISAKSITPIASPVCHNALALCAELDIDPLTLDHHGALKRGVDIQGIALCEQNGIHLHELQQYKAVRRDIDIKGISMCKANGLEPEVLHKMNVIEPGIDISGIAICEAMGIDIYMLQDYGFIEPGRSLRSIALLKEQGYDMEEIFLMDPEFDCIY